MGKREVEIKKRRKRQQREEGIPGVEIHPLNGLMV